MQPPDRGTDATPAAKDNDVPQDALVGALKSLYLAYQKTTIYPSGHPSIPQALAGAIRGIEEALSDDERLVVGVARDRFLLDTRPLSESTGALRALALLFHDLDVATLEFDRGMVLSELEGFIQELGSARRGGCRGPALVDELKKRDLGHIRVRPIDFDALSFTDGPREDDSLGEQEKALWRDLNVCLVQTASDDAPPPEEIARKIERQIEKQEGDGIGALGKRLEQASRKIGESDSPKKAADRKRLAKFIGALSRKLRVDLLRVDPAAPGESISRMTELADVVPETDLLEALQDVDRAGARVPGQMLTLLNKMMRLPGTRPTLADGLRQSLEKWGLSRTLAQDDPADFRNALSEVFQRRERDLFNPAPYQSLLDKLSKNVLSGESAESSKLYRDPQDPTETRLHLAEIAVRLLSKSGADPFRTGLLAQIDSATDLLLEHGRFDAVRDAAVAARAYSLAKSEIDATRQAARGYLEGFLADRRIKLILEQGFSDEEVPDSAVSLLGLGGISALDQLLGLLEANPGPNVTRTVHSFAARRPTEQLARVLKWRAERGLEALQPMLPVMRAIEPEEAVPLVEKLLDHDEASVRGEALRLIIDVQEDPAALEVSLRRTLDEADRQLTPVALRGLAGLETEGAIDLLGDYLEGRLESGLPTHDLGVQAARALIGKGEPGAERLCRALDRLGWSLMPGKAATAGLIHDILEPRRDWAGVQPCLSRWRRSPARLLRTVMRRRGRSGR